MKAVDLLPALVVTVDGSPLAAEQAAKLARVRVSQRLAAPAQCELSFLDQADASSGPVALAPGARLRLEVGERATGLFDGEITAVELSYPGEGGLEIRVRGYDRLHRLRKRQRVRAHVEVSVAGLARELAAAVGVGVDAEEDGPVHPLIVQHRQSDLELLVEESVAAGLYPVLEEGTLRLLTLEGRGEPVELELGDNLLRARLEANADPACRSVTTLGWDTSRVELHEARAARPRVGREVEVEAPPDAVGGDGSRTRTGEVARSAAVAGATAQAELDRRVADEVTLAALAQGEPRLRPGARVAIAGVARRYAGRYVVTAAEHTIDGAAGYVTEISTRAPRRAPRSAAAVAAWGRVTRVDDPDGLGRVKASLPAYGEVETDWLEVASVAAGPGKGLAALPDVADEVLILFVQGDPAEGVVIGGLWGAKPPPDDGVEGGAVRRFTLTTPGGQLVRLDDERRTLRLENEAGSYLELTPELATLHAATPLEIEAPGRQIKIRGDRIDFEKA